jgi:hypothetical protein
MDAVMGPTLELDLEQNASEARRETLSRWLRRVDDPSIHPSEVAEDCARVARSVAQSRHDFRASMVAAVRRISEDTPREHIDTINRFYQRVTEGRIRICELLFDMAGKLKERGFPVEGVDVLHEVIADYQRWKENLPDEMLLRYGPVRRRLAKAVEEGLRTPPAASNWQSLFEE